MDKVQSKSDGFVMWNLDEVDFFPMRIIIRNSLRSVDKERNWITQRKMEWISATERFHFTSKVSRQIYIPFPGLGMPQNEKFE